MLTEQPSLWDLLAEKLARQPELLAVARANCARWLREGHSATRRLRDWDNLLVDPCDDELAALLHEAVGEGSLFAQRAGYDRLREIMS